MGGGVVFKNASFIGCSEENHTAIFTGGILGFKSGVILSSGYISRLMGGTNTTGSCRGQGYAPLDKLVTGGATGQRQKTTDAAVLEIEFDCSASSDYYEVTLDYIFGSHEYEGLSENETSEFNDVAGIFLNGLEPHDNMATIQGLPVSVNSVRGSYFVNNTESARLPAVHGYSIPLKAVGRTTTKTNVIRIAIADFQDNTFSSYLFLNQSSLTCQALDKETMPSAQPSLSPATTIAPSISAVPTPLPDGLSVKETGNALQLARKIAGSSLTIKNATLAREACNGTSAGIYKGGAGSIVHNRGIVLSNGYASSLVDGDSGECEGRTYGPLEQLITEGFTMDATVLEIEFECNSDNVGSISLDYAFASFEYHHLVKDQATVYNDVAAIFLNGLNSADNIAVVDGGKVVDINNIKVGDELYIDNTKLLGDSTPPLFTGYTKPLVAEGRTKMKVNIIRIGIVDVNDSSGDSYIFIKEGSLQCKDLAPTVSPAPTSRPTRTCVKSGSKCSKDKECCKSSQCRDQKCYICQAFGSQCKDANDCCYKTDNSQVECRNDKCFYCQKPNDKCKRNSDCCNPSSDGLIAQCTSSKCRHCLQNESSCAADEDCCSNNCETSTCKSKSGGNSNNRLRPNRRKKGGRARPSRRKMNGRNRPNRRKNNKGRGRPNRRKNGRV
jgi:hypothetical protein